MTVGSQPLPRAECLTPRGVQHLKAFSPNLLLGYRPRLLSQKIVDPSIRKKIHFSSNFSYIPALSEFWDYPAKRLQTPRITSRTAMLGAGPRELAWPVGRHGLSEEAACFPTVFNTNLYLRKSLGSQRGGGTHF